MRDSIDLNSDLGEHDDFATSADPEILRFVSSANLSCAVHAGTPESIEATVRAALVRGVAIGAHPSYPDRNGFGRRPLDLPIHELAAEVRAQILWLKLVVERCGGQLRHVKPHGALYHDLVDDDARTAMLCDVIKDIDPALALMGLAETRTADVARMHGVRFIAEGFADRRYDAPGRLRSRAHSDAVLTDPDAVIDQVDRLLETSVESICVHGDTPDARLLARALRAHLDAKGIAVAPA